jgi:acetyl esterase/lipase
MPTHEEQKEHLMRNQWSSIWALVILGISAAATSAIAAAAAEPAPQPIWPGVAPGEAGRTLEEKWDQNKPGEKPFKRVTNVTKPTITLFRPPADKDTGVAIVVCPGGGYKALMMDYEGEDVARWLNTIGISGIVLKYRVPAPEGTPRHLPALQDAQRTIGIVRSKSKEWGIDPQRIGILGFSAGGHLACAASTNDDKRAYEAIDDADKLSCRPDFAVVIYPGGALNKTKDGLAEELRVTAQTPPAFIVQANDDRVNSENSVFYYLALKRAGVAAELHIYAEGGHGFGIRPSDKPHATWPQACEAWMKGRGILKGAAAAAAAVEPASGKPRAN